MSYDAMANAAGYGHDAGSWASDADKPICNCNAGPCGWLYRKGAGPDPARCPVHGDATTPSHDQPEGELPGAEGK